MVMNVALYLKDMLNCDEAGCDKQSDKKDKANCLQFTADNSLVQVEHILQLFLQRTSA